MARRTCVVIPSGLISAIDAAVGRRGRSRFIVQAAERELKRLAHERLVENGHLLACSAITVAEVFAGMKAKEREETVALLDSLEHYDITRPIAERAGLLRWDWSAHGRTLTLADLLIASVALTQGLILITDNTKDFPMEELRVHDRSLPAHGC
jgi:predicted nucleic acid-binding protein